MEYRLESRRGALGRMVMREETRGDAVRLESETEWSSAAWNKRMLLLSRADAVTFESQEFREVERDGQGERKSIFRFDEASGVVKLKRSSGEVAEAPWLEGYVDPLSMLLRIRHAKAGIDRLRLPMIGKTVEARLISEREIETPVGSFQARAFRIVPGSQLVWVAEDAPHAIVKFVQWTPNGPVEGTLDRLATEQRLPLWDQEKKPGRRRRGRRRRRSKSPRSGQTDA